MRYEINQYTQEQAKHIQQRYDKYIADTGRHVTMSHYIEHVYIRLGFASQFHKDFMQKLQRRELSDKLNE